MILTGLRTCFLPRRYFRGGGGSRFLLDERAMKIALFRGAKEFQQRWTIAREHAVRIPRCNVNARSFGLNASK